MTNRTRSREGVTKGVLLGTAGEIWNPNHFSYYYTTPYNETCIDTTNPGPPYRTGWGMEVRKAYINIYPSACFYSVIGNEVVNTRFRPSYFGTPSTLDLPTWVGYTTADQAKAWRKYRPGNAKASVGQFIGELSRVPTLPLTTILKARGTTERFRALGSEYLNVKFGWLPFVKDLQDMYKMYKSIDSALAQLRRDNKQKIRRRGGVSKRELMAPKYTSTTGTYLWPALLPQFYVNSSAAKRMVTETWTERSWFSAAFRYNVKNIDSVEWENRAILALFGLNPTPSLVWELTPWSWLIDWGVNVGDLLSNISTNAVDRLAADYAFLMTHTRFSRKVEESTVLRNSGLQSVPISAKAEFVAEVKFRQRASPFGFGIIPGGLTDSRAVTLSALGISRRW